MNDHGDCDICGVNVHGDEQDSYLIDKGLNVHKACVLEEGRKKIGNKKNK